MFGKSLNLYSDFSSHRFGLLVGNLGYGSAVLSVPLLGVMKILLTPLTTR